MNGHGNSASNSYQIQYHYLVVKKDIPKLGKLERARIKLAIEQKLTKHPEIFGQPLRRSLKNYRKLRVGDYRIIFKIESKIILILLIQHRSVIYKEALKRT